MGGSGERGRGKEGEMETADSDRRKIGSFRL